MIRGTTSVGQRKLQRTTNNMADEKKVKLDADEVHAVPYCCPFYVLSFNLRRDSASLRR